MPLSPPAAERPLRVRARPDILAAAVRVAGSRRWVVTDPVTLAHYDLTEEEYALLGGLREGATLRDLQRLFERRFAPLRIGLDRVWEYVTRLHAAGLAVAVGGGQGARLMDRDRRTRDAERRWGWTRLLSVRLVRFDPDRALGWLAGLSGWAYSTPAALAAGALVAAALTVIVRRFDRLVAELPSLEQLARPENLALLAGTTVVVKGLHELGHALTCKRMGARVHEMGVMLLCFAPAAYCDTSDAWRLASKRKRAAVTAGGVTVELLLASVATLAWAAAEPGPIRLVAMSVMIVSSVGAVLVNGNPLLRYDGYYLLSDWTETPNLWQRSREALWKGAERWLLRPTGPVEPSRPWWLPWYGAASSAFMGVTLVGVVWLTAVTLRPWRLEALAYALAGLVLASLVAASARRAVSLRRRAPGLAKRLRPARAVATLAVLALGGWCVAVAPVRFSAHGGATVVLTDATPVAATLEGRLAYAVAAGARVAPGDVIARLQNPEIERMLVRLGAELTAERRRVAQLEAVRARDPQASQELPAAQAAVADLEQRLAGARREAARLVVRAPRAGVVIAAPRAHAESNPHRLGAWSGSLLEPRNLGAWVATGATLCLVGDSTALAVEVTLDEADLERVAPGQGARVALDQTPGRVLHGRVVEVGADAIGPLDGAPSGPSAGRPPGGGRGETLWGAETGSGEPAQRPRYRARVTLDSVPEGLLPGGQGRAKIDSGDTTVSAWVATRLRQAFRLP